MCGMFGGGRVSIARGWGLGVWLGQYSDRLLP